MKDSIVKKVFYMKRQGIVRSLGVFIAVIIVLLGVTIGGIGFAKNRNAMYAKEAADGSQHQTNISTKTATGQQDSVSASAGQQNAQTSQQTGQSTSSATQHIATVAQVPSTGPSAELIVTGVLITASFYLALLIWRSRTAYKRLLP